MVTFIVLCFVGCMIRKAASGMIRFSAENPEMLRTGFGLLKRMLRR